MHHYARTHLRQILPRVGELIRTATGCYLVTGIVSAGPDIPDVHVIARRGAGLEAGRGAGRPSPLDPARRRAAGRGRAVPGTGAGVVTARAGAIAGRAPRARSAP